MMTHLKIEDIDLISHSLLILKRTTRPQRILSTLLSYKNRWSYHKLCIHLGDDSTVESIGEGDYGTLSNVVIAPAMQTALVSVPQLSKKYTVVFNATKTDPN